MCDLFGLSCNGIDRATQSLTIFSEFNSLMFPEVVTTDESSDTLFFLA